MGDILKNLEKLSRLEIRGHHFYDGPGKWLVRGVTYGPFRPRDDGFPYPVAGRMCRDFEAMATTGINAVRVYTVPPPDLAAAAGESGLRLLVDIPWPKHIDVYGSPKQRQACLDMVEEGLRKVRNWPHLLGVLLGNEIPADIVRWEGQRRVESFLRDLYQRGKDQAPEIPMGFANFPSTEYLELGFFDFLGFNVYLHDSEDFLGYLTRLRHLAPEKPLVLTEFGIDSRRHGEGRQAEVFARNYSLPYHAGFAGAFAFSWTDEWHAGGYDMTDWSFGITDRERRPKPVAEVVSHIYRTAPQCHEIDPVPRVSVVVATYNGARTLEACLRSLQDLRYPDYEIVVVDDGSTDATSGILADFPGLRVVRQENRGLSAARNAGIQASTGDIIAFTDSDCVVDPDWLYHLVWTMEHRSYAGAGGPNLTPEEETVSRRAIALAPGHATHVLLNEVEAEHVPGCNMAFRRSVLEAIDGFDPQLRTAGDDVDAIWRMRDAGHRVGFSPAAFVWHHRRPTLRGYLKQQIGYGRAEALLLRKHPHRFNDRGQSLWQGAIYTSQETRPLLAGRRVHYGTFCSAGFQCVYEHPAGFIDYLPVSLEWWVVCLLLIGFGAFAFPALIIGGMAMLLPLGIGGFKAWRKWKATRRPPATAWWLAWPLWVMQPVLRGWARHWHRLPSEVPSRSFREWRGPRVRPGAGGSGGKHVLEYWGEKGVTRLDALRAVTDRMTAEGWHFTPNSGWEPWDIAVVISRWFKVHIISAAENHGGPKRLLRTKFLLLPTSLYYLLLTGGLAVSAALALHNTVWGRLFLTAFLVLLWLVYRRGFRGRRMVEGLTDSAVREMGFFGLHESEGVREGSSVSRERRPVKA